MGYFKFEFHMLHLRVCITDNKIGTWSMPQPYPGRHGGTPSSVVSSATLIGTLKKK